MASTDLYFQAFYLLARKAFYLPIYTVLVLQYWRPRFSFRTFCLAMILSLSATYAIVSLRYLHIPCDLLLYYIRTLAVGVVFGLAITFGQLAQGLKILIRGTKCLRLEISPLVFFCYAFGILYGMKVDAGEIYWPMIIGLVERGINFVLQSKFPNGWRKAKNWDQSRFIRFIIQ